MAGEKKYNLGLSDPNSDFQPRSSLSDYEVKGEVQQIKMIQRVGRRNYRQAMRSGDSTGAMKAIDWMSGHGVRPRAGIQQAGVMENAARQRGEWVHAQIAAQNAKANGQTQAQPGVTVGGVTQEQNQNQPGGPVANAQGNTGTGVAPTTVPKTTERGAVTMEQVEGRDKDIAPIMNGQGGSPASGEASPLLGGKITTGPLAQRQELFEQMRGMAQRGEDPDKLRDTAIKSGTVDDTSFNLGLEKLRHVKPLQSRLPMDQAERLQATYEAQHGTPEAQAAVINPPRTPENIAKGNALRGIQDIFDARDNAPPERLPLNPDGSIQLNRDPMTARILAGREAGEARIDTKLRDTLARNNQAYGVQQRRTADYFANEIGDLEGDLAMTAGNGIIGPLAGAFLPRESTSTPFPGPMDYENFDPAKYPRAYSPEAQAQIEASNKARIQAITQKTGPLAQTVETPEEIKKLYRPGFNPSEKPSADTKGPSISSGSTRDRENAKENKKTAEQRAKTARETEWMRQETERKGKERDENMPALFKNSGSFAEKAIKWGNRHLY